MQPKYDEQLLLDFVEGELDAAGRGKVLEWARQDPRLDRLLHQMIADRGALQALPDPPAPQWLMEEVDRELERELLLGDVAAPRGGDEARNRYRVHPITVTLAIAASIVVVGGVVLWSLLIMPDPPQVADSTTDRRDSPKFGAPKPPDNTPAAPEPAVAEKPPPPPTSQRVVPPSDAAKLTQVQPPTAAAPEPEPKNGEPMFTLPWVIDLEQALTSVPRGAEAIEPPAPAVELARSDEGKLDAESRPEHAADPPMPLKQSFGQVAPPPSPDLLTIPKHLRRPNDLSTETMEVADAAGVAELVKDLASAAGLARNCRLEIVTKNAQKTRAKLAALSGEKELTTASTLRVQPDKFNDALGSLRAELDHVSVKLYRPRPDADRAASAREADSEPDYAGILADQLPGSTEQSGPITLPVTIREVQQ